MCLYLIVSNCTAERSFLKLKRIKNELRKRIGQDRVNYLSMMNIENDVLRIIECSDIIDNF